MRKITNIVSTGCFFLCLGGWVYNGPARAADEATQVREAALNTAVAQAVPEIPSGIQAQVETAPAATRPAAAPAAAAPSVDITAAVVNVGVDGRVEQLSFQDLDVLTVLRLLSIQTKRNIIATKDVKGTVTANLYNVTFAEALAAILRPNGFEYVEQGNFIYVYTAKEWEEIRKRDRRPINKVFHLKYINATEAEAMIVPLKSSIGSIAKSTAGTTGLTAGLANTGGQSLTLDDILVINDYAENMADIEATIRQIDVRPKQVLIEATVMNAQLHDENALGIDLISVSGVDFSSLTGGAFTSGSGGGGSSGGTSGTPINGPAGIYNTFTGNQTQLNTGTDFAGGVPSGGLSIGFLSNHVSFFMRALETVSDVTIVTNPKILTLNKQQGYVHIGQKLGYQTTSTNQTSTQQTVQFLDVGTTLMFRPFIAEDGYVRMEIHPEDASGFIDTKGVPQTNVTEVTSNIMIKDGRTIVIGGLFSEDTEGSRAQVPVLGNIPGVGPFFRRTNDKTIRNETIVMVTPHVINDDTALYEETQREQEDVQRMVLGTRAGLQPWGRDRIAHIWYAKAQECAQAGDTEKALMFCDWALNTNYRLMEAIKLREELTHMKMDEMRGSTVVDLVKNTLRGDAETTPDKGTSGNYPPPATAPATAPADKK